MRRALYRRALRQIRASLNGATPEQLMAAIEAETPTGTIAKLMSAVPASSGLNAPCDQQNGSRTVRP